MIGPGIHTVSAADYHADQLCDQPTLSCGIAKTILTRSPLHAWAAHPRLNPDYQRKDEGKFDLGSTVHAMILEGVDDVEIVEADTWATNFAKAARIEAKANGRTALLGYQYRNSVAMVNAIRQQADSLHLEPPMLAAGKPEQTVVWEEDGVTCRARIDWLHDDLSAVDDVKTTGATANPEKWARSTMFTIGADLQVAFYLRGIEAVTGQIPAWRFLVAETAAPHAISVVTLDDDALAVAQAKVTHAIDTWRECLTTGVWPGYTKEIVRAAARDWETDWITDELEEIAWAQM